MNLDTGRLLVIDDEDLFGRMLASQLETRGYQVSFMKNGADALLAYEQLSPDVVVVDLLMPGLDGVQVLAELRRQDPSATVILLSGEVDVRTTVRALRAGAEDVQTKPVDFDLLSAAIDRGIQRSRMARAHRMATARVVDPYGLLDESPLMRRVLRLVERFARSALPILVVGEPGTGKGAIAELLHQLSPGADKRYVRLPCAAFGPTVPANVPEDERIARDGINVRELIARAAGGTLCLEDVAELSLPAQELFVELLNAAAEERVGARLAAHVVITTHRDLAQDVRSGALRVDLYDMLAMLPLPLPSLRSRGAEVICNLAARALREEHAALGRGPSRLTPKALAWLATLEWPGNVRQLHRVIAESFIGALDREALEPSDLQSALERAGLGKPTHLAANDDRSMEQVERRHIASVLSQTGGHRTEAARILGITRSTLYKKMSEYALEEVGGGGPPVAKAGPSGTP